MIKVSRSEPAKRSKTTLGSGLETGNGILDSQWKGKLREVAGMSLSIPRRDARKQ